MKKINKDTSTNNSHDLLGHMPLLPTDEGLQQLMESGDLIKVLNGDTRLLEEILPRLMSMSIDANIKSKRSSAVLNEYSREQLVMGIRKQIYDLADICQRMKFYLDEIDDCLPDSNEDS